MADVRLEPFRASYLDGFRALLEDPLVLRFTRVPEPVPPGFAEVWLGVYEEGRENGTREAFALLDEGGGFLGVGVAPRIDWETATAELGYVVAESARGRGVAQQSLRQLTAWAFERGCVRLELLIHVENEPSIRVAERCGYLLEGVLRSLHLKPGVRADMEIWSRLVTDP